MILGGIPYYMGYFSPGESLAQNIDRILFAKELHLQGSSTGSSALFKKKRRSCEDR